MSKGKKGEMKFGRSVIEIALRENKLDFTRTTVTNTPDNGVDYSLYAPEQLGQKFDEIVQTGTSEIDCSNDEMIKIRVDVKNKDVTDKDDAEKFIDDMNKSPKSSEHWLVYDEKMSRPAKKVIEEAQKSNTNKTIRIFSRTDMMKIESHYRSLPEYDENQ